MYFKDGIVYAPRLTYISGDFWIGQGVIPGIATFADGINNVPNLAF